MLSTQNKHITYSKWFWIGLSFFSALSVLSAIHFFPRVFPFVSVNIRMSREQAQGSARTIAEKYDLGPSEPDSAAHFQTDSTSTCFIELDGGGKNALIDIIENKLYQPYVWVVRHYKEYEKRELIIRFTPDGQLYGFVETLSENDPGAQLSEESARSLAQKHAINDWNVDLTPYALVESSQKLHPGGRLDHTFIYERANTSIGKEGFFRLKLTVSGDKLTQVTHFIKVPESFTRSYNNMRSANNTIGFLATIIMAILYIFGCIFFGFYYLNRQKAFIWQPAKKTGIFLGLIVSLVSITMLPVSWMYYYTALSYKSYLMNQLLSTLISFIMQSIGLTVIIAVAEGLTRLARPYQPQIWRLWSANNASSYQTVGRILGGYIFVGFQFSYVIFFYFLSARYLNWWMPSELLINPNILSSYLPWFSPLAQSLYAGIMEECLFRALPLASAILLGNRFGKKNWWIGAALIIQALIFGAAHANYPTQPAYTRIIELFIPSVIWGIMYLRFGLITTILSHTVYDIIWFSLPLFVSHAPYAMIYRAIIILISCTPLFVTAYHFIRQRKLSQMDDAYTNQAWTVTESKQEIIQEKVVYTQTTQRTLPKSTPFILLMFSSVAWVMITQFSHHGVRIEKTNAQAQAYAQEYMAQKGITLSSAWKAHSLLFAHYAHVPAIALQHTFMWRTYGSAQYDQLLNSYLEPAHWTVRFVQFEGDLINRAQEYKFFLHNNTLYHQLPESEARESLSKESARLLAHEALQKEFHKDVALLKEINVQDYQLPNRKDWLFTFEDQSIGLDKGGSARIDVSIGGNEVTLIRMYIHIPEEWIRNEHDQTNQLHIFQALLSLIFACLVLWLLRNSTYNQLFTPLFYPFLVLFLVGNGILTFLDMPTLIGSFNTSEPYINQLIRTLIGKGISTLTVSALFAYLAQYVLHSARGTQHTIASYKNDLPRGIALGITYSVLHTISQNIHSFYNPVWPAYAVLQSCYPLVYLLIECALNYVRTTSIVLLVSMRLSRTYNFSTVFMVLLYGMMGLINTSLPVLSVSAVTLWLVQGIALGGFFALAQKYVLNSSLAVAPFAVATYMITLIIRQYMFEAYPCVQLYMIINAAVIAGLSMWWYKKQTE